MEATRRAEAILSIFVALLARARPLRVLPGTRAFKNQQLPSSGHHGIKSALSLGIAEIENLKREAIFFWP